MGRMKIINQKKMKILIYVEKEKKKLLIILYPLQKQLKNLLNGRKENQ